MIGLLLNKYKIKTPQPQHFHFFRVNFIFQIFVCFRLCFRNKRKTSGISSLDKNDFWLKGIRTAYKVKWIIDFSEFLLMSCLRQEQESGSWGRVRKYSVSDNTFSRDKKQEKRSLQLISLYFQLQGKGRD